MNLESIIRAWREQHKEGSISILKQDNGCMRISIRSSLNTILCEVDVDQLSMDNIAFAFVLCGYGSMQHESDEAPEIHTDAQKKKTGKKDRRSQNPVEVIGNNQLTLEPTQAAEDNDQGQEPTQAAEDNDQGQQSKSDAEMSMEDALNTPFELTVRKAALLPYDGKTVEEVRKSCPTLLRLVLGRKESPFVTKNTMNAIRIVLEAPGK